ncbi:MAG TPA: hypothetical protein VN645_09010 [Steroidobacteraceae bacterium]|nr:hypothetical protein [Steroidobacteraceae bacterium]
MNFSFHKALPALLAVALLQNVSAAESAAKHETDEVVVNGERVKLDAMRHEIIQLEDQFYSRYNELNTIRDFDIQCIEEARTGTRFIKRTCKPVYQEKAVNAEGKAAFEVLQSFRSRGMAGSPPVPAAGEIERRRLDFQKNMEEVARRNPELSRLLQQRGELIERYKAQQKKIFGSDTPED